MDDRHLHSLLAELGKLKKIRTVIKAISDVILLTDRMLPRAERGRMNEIQLTSLVLHFCAKPAVNAADTRLLLGPLEHASPARINATVAQPLPEQSQRYAPGPAPASPAEASGRRRRRAAG